MCAGFQDIFLPFFQCLYSSIHLASLPIALVIIRHFVLRALIIICTFSHKNFQFYKEENRKGEKKKAVCSYTAESPIQLCIIVFPE